MKNLKVAELRKDLKEVTRESEYKWDIKKVGSELRISNSYLSDGEYFRFYESENGDEYVSYKMELWYEHNEYSDTVCTIFIGTCKWTCMSEELTYDVLKKVFSMTLRFFNHYM